MTTESPEYVYFLQKRLNNNILIIKEQNTFFGKNSSRHQRTTNKHRSVNFLKFGRQTYHLFIINLLLLIIIEYETKKKKERRRKKERKEKK